jgi:hypothetical protein
MDTVRLPDDGSMPARKRLRTLTEEIKMASAATPEGRDPTRIPDVDWTGHQYKAPRDCHVTNPDHRGREATGR